METKIKYPIWIWVIFGVFVMLAFLINPIMGIINLIVFFSCKGYFEKWAIKLNKSPNVAFILVLFLGLLGQLIFFLIHHKELDK